MRRPGRRLIAAIALVAIAFATVAGAIGVWWAGPGNLLRAPAAARLLAPLPELPDFASVRAAHRPSYITVLDRNGVAVAAVRTDFAERRGQWVPLQAISPAFISAVLLSEDRRFRDHDGVDWFAVAAAGRAWISGRDARGASTVSMQLVALLDPSLRRPAGGRGLMQKLDQARQAWRLESQWSKDQILEAYVNLVAFRGELRGIDAVARVMFGKHSHGLDQRESAVAAALLRGPNASAARVSARACALLSVSQPDPCHGLSDRVAVWLAATARPAADTPALAPHFARLLAARGKELGDASLRGSIDAELQRRVAASVRRHLAGMEQSRLTDAAVVVLDNATGEVLAYVGSSDAYSDAAHVDHARALRQAGSTLKPFLYALAFERRYLTAASLLQDTPLDVGTASGLYIPQNYDRRHAGLVSARTALASSLNIPAVRTLMLMGPERFAARLRALGLPLAHDADHYGYSLALGSADIDLLSLANAYRTLANGGRWSGPPVLEPRNAGDPGTGPVRQAIDPMAAWIVGDILADRGARARTFGLETALSTRHWTAVKTGTSKDMRDNWCVGWSGRHTVGVWVGNSAGFSMREVSGVSAAAPIWHEVMSLLHEGNAGGPPPAPAGLARQRVTFDEVPEAPRIEYFLPGTELTRVAPVAPAGEESARIADPVDGTVIALDPDMPAGVQRLALRTGKEASNMASLRWHIDGQLVAEGPTAHWIPRPGRHRVVLTDGGGKPLDQVTIHVRDVPGATRRR